MLADALEHLVRGIVANPDEVSVRDKDLRRGRMLEVRVNPDDIGKVIGRSGREFGRARIAPARIGPTALCCASWKRRGLSLLH